MSQFFFQCRTKNEKIMNTKYSNIVKVSHKHKKKIWIIRMLWRHPSWAHTINRFNRVMICVGCKNVTSTVLSPCRVSVWFMNTNSCLTANKLSKLYTIWYLIFIYLDKHNLGKNVFLFAFHRMLHTDKVVKGYITWIHFLQCWFVVALIH